MLAEDKKNCYAADAIQSRMVKMVAHAPILARQVPAAADTVGTPDTRSGVHLPQLRMICDGACRGRVGTANSF